MVGTKARLCNPPPELLRGETTSDVVARDNRGVFKFVVGNVVVVEEANGGSVVSAGAGEKEGEAEDEATIGGPGEGEREGEKEGGRLLLLLLPPRFPFIFLKSLS